MMVEFSDCPYEAFYGPEDDAEDWETVYASDIGAESLTDDSEPTEKEYAAAEAVGDMEPWEWLPDVVGEGRLSGEGTGVEVTGVVAAVLDNRQKYGFEFTFYKVDDVTPWEEGKEERQQTI